MRWYQVLTSDTQVTGERQPTHEESDNNHEEEEERLEGRKRRRLSLSDDRCENPGADGLAGRYARSDQNAHQAGRPRSGRGVEMEKALELDVAGSGVVAPEIICTGETYK